METTCYIIVGVFIASVYAQDTRSLIVKFMQSGEQHGRLGGQLNFSCEINRPLTFVTNKDSYVEIVRQSAGQGSEVILAHNENLTDSRNYFLDIKPVPSNGINIIFNILNVTDVDEGKLICRARSGTDQGTISSGEDYLTILVLRSLDNLYLKFSDRPKISNSTKDVIEVDSGTYNVSCIAEGSNPSADVHLDLNGSKVMHNVKINTKRLNGTLIKYRTTVIAIVSLTTAIPTGFIECVAQSKLKDERRVEVPFEIKMYKPTIACNKSKERTEQQHQTVICTVEYEDIHITGFKYETVGNRRTTIADFDKNETMSQNGTKITVCLQFEPAKYPDFEKDFYLIVEYRDGHEARYSIKLPKDNRGSCNNSTILSTSLTTLIMSCVLWISLQ